MSQDKPGQTNSEKTYVVAITGASGSIYGIRLIKALIEKGYQVLAIVSDAGHQVLIHEMGYNPRDSFYDFLESYGVNFSKGSRLEVFSQEEIASAPASGSFVHSGMVVMPCSMKTLSAIASGYADNLITRACDVCLKERRTLILAPRETPMGIIHLENMARAARAGAVIMPPNPSFYTYPRTVEALVDTVVARTMDHLGAEHGLGSRWKS